MNWKYFIIFSCIFVICSADGDKNRPYRKKPYHHHHHDPFYHHLFYGGSYLTFLLIKVKLVFVLAMVFTFMLFTGKLFALIKYMEYSKREEHHHDPTPQKIYIQAPSHDHDHSLSSGPSPVSYSSDSVPFSSRIYSSIGPPFSSKIYSSIGPRLTADDKFSYKTETGNSYSPDSGPGLYYDSPSYYYGRIGRSYESNSLYDKFNLFTRIIKKLNLTELTFEKMNLKSEECKKKFVCKMDFDAKYSSILSFFLNTLRDESYKKYRTKTEITSIDDCENFYPKCDLNLDETKVKSLKPSYIFI